MNAPFLIITLALLFFLCHANREKYSSWFPRVYLKDIRQTTDGTYSKILTTPKEFSQRKNTTTDLETPVFAYFDNGNSFKEATEVDSLYSSIDDSFNILADKTSIDTIIKNREDNLKDSNNKLYNTHVQFLHQRGGNAL